MSTIRVPEGFVLGVATSAYQVEGAVDRDGRSASVWDTFSRTPGRVHDDVPGDRGAEHYDRLDEDLDLLVELGVDSYRFSISWSRLIPSGDGDVNPEGAAFYGRLIDGLLARGIAPNVTLYHWDLPQVLQDRGGWANRDIADWFAHYARAAFDLYGDRVPLWATINEPIAIWVGYGLGVFAPGIADARIGKQAMHHAMLAHGRAVAEFRASGAIGRIGIVVDVWKRHLVADTAENRAIADRDEDDSFRFFFDELFAGGPSERSRARMLADGVLPDIQPEDADVIGAPIDFLGINVYARVLIDAATYRPNWWEGQEVQPGGNYLSNGVEVYPQALVDAARIARDEYGVEVPIFITENGTAADPEPGPGVVDDQERIDYLSAFLAAAIEAHDAGLGVEGYYVWSLVDNYEWAAGYSMRYGLYRLDPVSFDRSPKRSAEWYRTVTRDRALTLR